MNLAFSILQWIFIKACFVASYEFVKIKPRAISRFCGIFSPSFFLVPFGHMTRDVSLVS